MLRLFKQYYPIRNLFFVIGEGLIIYLSVLLACWAILDGSTDLLDPGLSAKALLITFICQTFLYYYDLYDLNVTKTFLELGIRLLQALGSSSIFLAIIYFFLPLMIIEKGIFIISVCFIVIFITAWRYGYLIVLNREMFNQKIILLGSGELAQNITAEINAKRDSGYKIAATVTEHHDAACFEDISSGRTICKENYKDLCEIAQNLKIKKIIVALKEKRKAFPTEELLKCRVNGIEILEGNSFYEMLTGKLIVEQINPAWLIFSDGFHKPFTKRFFKRSTDILFSLILLIITLPVIIVIAILIKIDSKGPAIFSQERVGMNKKIYRVHKFRSMIADAEQHSGPVWAKKDDDRITRIGKFIRRCRIDEIPQLWNVLKGDMSFVGPRPEREFFVEKLEKIIPYYRERFTVKPGLTGWAQINYGYGATVEDAIEKLNYDLFYIKNMSILMDLMVVLRTVKTVFFSKGAH